jgi:hypothetical protein
MTRDKSMRNVNIRIEICGAKQTCRCDLNCQVGREYRVWIGWEEREEYYQEGLGVDSEPDADTCDIGVWDDGTVYAEGVPILRVEHIQARNAVIS